MSLAAIYNFKRHYVRIAEVILNENIENIGKKGDIVRIPAADMRHKLHPYGKAFYATEENIRNKFLPLARTGLPLRVFGIPIVHSALIPEKS